MVSHCVLIVRCTKKQPLILTLKASLNGQNRPFSYWTPLEVFGE